MTNLTMGSLFDGSGGFPLGAILNGITPIWASEIEPFPIRVTTKRLPFMKHYGNIRKMHGAGVEPVDIVTFGSPCTNLSVAGRREGLSGEQSVLFYEAIRIIKEMRCATDGQYPRWICWENVPGCYSSSGGRDFQQVLTEITKIKDETAVIPMPEKGKWLTAGEIVGDSFSVAYRTLDAQFWGVAQRRRRCYLVADFAGECAGKILFEFESLSGYSPQGTGQGQGTANGVEGCAGETGHSIAFEPGAISRLGGHAWEDTAGTLRADMGDNQLAVATYDARGNGNGKTVSTITGDHNGHISDYTSLVLNYRSKNLESDLDTAYSPAGTDYKGTRCVVGPMAPQTAAFMGGQSSGSGSIAYNKEVAPTIRGKAGGNSVPMIMAAFTQNQRNEVRDLQGRAGALAAEPGAKQQTYILQDSAAAELSEETVLACDCRNHNTTPVSGTLQAKNNGGQSLNYINPVLETRPRCIVRRLTPQECALLQGFPVDWCAGLGIPSPTEEEILFWQRVFEEHRLIMGTSSKAKSRKQIMKWLNDPYSDSAEYKMWGNGVALPCVCFVMAGIAWAATL